MSVLGLIKKQTGIFVNPREQNKLIDSVNRLRKTSFARNQFNVLDRPDGQYISLRDQESGESFEHDFQIYLSSNNSSSFYVRDGQWRRNGDTAIWSNGASFNPISEQIVANNFSGNVYSYVIRGDSDGGTDALIVQTTGVELPQSANSFQMEELIGIIGYTNGTAVSISQKIVGSIDDTVDTGGPAYDMDNFGITVTKANVSGSYETGVIVHGGEVRRRDEYNTVMPLTNTHIDVDKKVYIQLADLSSALTYDPGLIPVSPTIKIENTYPTTPVEGIYNFGYIKLYELIFEQVSIDATGTYAGTSGKKYDTLIIKKMHDGAVYDDWVRPDGKISGYTDIDKVPRVRGLDFNTKACIHKGELQDRNIFETITNGSNFLANDRVLGYYDAQPTGDSLKYYGFIDSQGKAAGHSGCGKSLDYIEEGADHYFQLHGFYKATPTASITNASDLTVAKYSVVARNATGPEITYLDLSSMSVASAGSASTAGTAGYAYTAGTAGTALSANIAHSNLIDILANNAGDDHNGILSTVGNFPYIASRGNYSRNAMALGLGDAAYKSSINVNGRLLYDQDELLSLDWDNKLLTDYTNNTSLNWGDRILSDSSELTSIDWEGRTLQNDAGDAILSYGATEDLNFKTGTTPNNWAPATRLIATVPYATIKSSTTDVTLDANVDMYLYTRTGGLNISVADDCNLLPKTDNTSDLLIGNGGKNWKNIAGYFNQTYLLKGNGTATVDAPTVNIGNATINIFYDTQQGQDVTDWFKAGGMIKSGATKLTGAYFFNSNGEIIGPYELVVKA